MGQQMLDKDFIKQPQMRKWIQNSLENRLQEIGQDETWFVQNGLRIHNSSNVSRVEPFSIRPNYIQ